MENPRDQRDSANSLVSAARRRALKVGLAAVPTILTLRSKPAFGTDACGPSMSMSAANSHHVLDVLPGCNSNSFKK
jgi:hypothetical protein